MGDESPDPGPSGSSSISTPSSEHGGSRGHPNDRSKRVRMNSLSPAHTVTGRTVIVVDSDTDPDHESEVPVLLVRILIYER